MSILFTLLNSSSLQIFAAACDKGKTFFGLPVWYKYLPSTGEDELGYCKFSITDPTQFALVGLAIVEILLRLGGIVAFGYIVYGGVQLLMSQGEPDKRSKAIQTIINAVIGMVITLLAVGIVAYLGSRF